MEEQVAAKASCVREKGKLEGIRIVDGNSERTSEVSVSEVEHFGAVVTYLVRIGCFEMDVTLLHSKYNASNALRPYLNKGTFGAILALTGA